MSIEKTNKKQKKSKFEAAMGIKAKYLEQT